MFNIFKKKSKLDVLKTQYKRLIEEAYRLSTINRTESDKKYAEAESIMNQLEHLQKES